MKIFQKGKLIYMNNKETVDIYEYIMHKGSFEKRKYNAVVEYKRGETCYRFRTKAKNGVCIYSRAMERVYDNRIFSLIDDEKAYRRRLGEYYAERAMSHLELLQNDLDVLSKLGEKDLFHSLVRRKSVEGCMHEEVNNDESI